MRSHQKVSTRSHPLTMSTRSQPFWKKVSMRCHCPRNVSIPYSQGSVEWNKKQTILESGKIATQAHNRASWEVSQTVLLSQDESFVNILCRCLSRHIKIRMALSETFFRHCEASASNIMLSWPKNLSLGQTALKKISRLSHTFQGVQRICFLDMENR